MIDRPALALICCAAMCLWPQWFVPLVLGIASLCGLTLVARLHAGWTKFGEKR